MFSRSCESATDRNKQDAAHQQQIISSLIYIEVYSLMISIILDRIECIKNYCLGSSAVLSKSQVLAAMRVCDR